MIRPDDGLPIHYKTLPTYQEAKNWATQEEAKRRQDRYFPEKFKQKHTLAELIDRYIQDILPSIKSEENALLHINWWKLKLGKFTLNHVSSDLISQHRREPLDAILPKTNDNRILSTPTSKMKVLLINTQEGFKIAYECWKKVREQ